VGRAENADDALEPTLGATAGCHDLQRRAEVRLDTHFHRRNFQLLRSEALVRRVHRSGVYR
ncbi:MAG: hypothetical protein RBU30_15255, partial [Polyangia bacterium]|nr:hypothetical protein [Polyangia bacterium]